MTTYLCLAKDGKEITVLAILQDETLATLLRWKNQNYPGWEFVESWY